MRVRRGEGSVKNIPGLHCQNSRWCQREKSSCSLVVVHTCEALLEAGAVPHPGPTLALMHLQVPIFPGRPVSPRSTLSNALSPTSGGPTSTILSRPGFQPLRWGLGVLSLAGCSTWEFLPREVAGRVGVTGMLWRGGTPSP